MSNYVIKQQEYQLNFCDKQAQIPSVAVPSYQKISFKRNVLSLAVAVLLPFSSLAANFSVTESNDDGTGLVAQSLSWAILQANTSIGDDVIILNTDVLITGVMKRLIDSNISLRSDSIKRTIDGGNNFRPLFIKSGQVLIKDVDFVNGLAKGGDSQTGGGGAGLGGSIFIYSGNVSIQSASISNSHSIGGVGYAGGYIYGNLINYNSGGGGMFGSSAGQGSGGGGLFDSTQNAFGAYAGYGHYNQTVSDFGKGGDGGYTVNGNQIGFSGGFGGGGGYGYLNQSSSTDSLGGFGGGGGSTFNNYGGNGGFGGGGGLNLANLYGGTDSSGVAGYGASGSNGAGLGGAIFVRSGHLDLINVSLQNNRAHGSLFGIKGLGGALYIMHSITNSNGNNQGMPSVLPTVSACSLTLMNNVSDSDPNTSNNNDNLFDLANNFTDFGECIVFNNGFE